MAFHWLDDSLSERAEQGLLRQRHCQQYEKDSIICINGEHYLNFSSNDYLGMRQHEGVLQSWVEGLAQFGGGSGASPLVTGHTQAHLALEAYMADGLNREVALLFNSGFAANQALCMALFPHMSHPNKSVRAGHIIADKLMHASFLEGAQCVSDSAKLRRFKHNDLSHLESVLSSVCHSQLSDAVGNSDANLQDILIASEGVFSMDGDVAPCEGIAELAAKYNAWFMLDDAHGMGVLGENGFGTAEALNLSQQQAPIVMGTFPCRQHKRSRPCTLSHISPVILPAAKRYIPISPISESRFKNVLDRHLIQARKAMRQLKSLWGGRKARFSPLLLVARNVQLR